MKKEIATEKEFKPTRLTKKALLEFCDQQIQITNVVEGSDEERRERFDKEWLVKNEEAKKNGFNKKKRKNLKGRLKAKHGIGNFGNHNNYKMARVKFIKHMKTYFGL